MFLLMVVGFLTIPTTEDLMLNYMHRIYPMMSSVMLKNDKHQNKGDKKMERTITLYYFVRFCFLLALTLLAEALALFVEFSICDINSFISGSLRYLHLPVASEPS